MADFLLQNVKLKVNIWGTLNRVGVNDLNIFGFGINPVVAVYNVELVEHIKH